MKRKFIPILVLIPIFLISCSLFSSANSNQPLTDSEMATRVAELLSTMTTPTSEIVFPPTATLGPINAVSTSTPNVIVVVSPTATVEFGGDLPTSTAVIMLPTFEVTPTPEATIAPNPTATLNVPSSDPINTLGNPSGSDDMSSTTQWAWDTSADDFLTVAMGDGFLKVTNINKTAGGWRMPALSQQVDDYIELTTNSGTCNAKDSYGIIFRVPVLVRPDQGYIYQVTCDGYYRLWKWDGKVGDNGQAVSLINWRQSGVVNTGANQTNRLGVMVVDDEITLYMNGIKLETVTDSSYAAGFFGVFVRSGSDTNYTAKFDAMKYWTNPAQ